MARRLVGDPLAASGKGENQVYKVAHGSDQRPGRWRRAARAAKFRLEDFSI
jgi:hypothetical protein